MKVGPFQFEKIVVCKGSGHTLPNDFSKCKILLRRRSTAENSYPLDYETDAETEVVVGHGRTYISCVIDLILQTMAEGSTVLVKFPLVPLTELVLEVTLVAFVQSEDVFRLGPEAKLARAVQLKTTGMECFQGKSLEVAFYKFSRSLKYLLCIRDVDSLKPEISSEVTKLRCQCYLNLSACQLQTKHFPGVVENCSKALKIDPGNVKGLFRRAQAFAKLGEYDKARDDLVQALALEPNNGAVSRSLALVKAALKDTASEMAKSMSKMFQ